MLDDRNELNFMRILIIESLAQSGIDLLRAEKDWEVVVRPHLLPKQLTKEIQQCDALVIRGQTKVTSEIIQAATRLKLIGRAGTGVDNIDLETATQRGIVVMNAPEGNSISVAELTLGLMLALTRSILPASFSTKQGKWEKKDFTGFELKDKTLGIVGFGKIGSEVARRAKAFEMKVIAYDPFVSGHKAADQAVELVGWDRLLSASDILTLHVPLLDQTKEILNAKSLARIKKGVRLINTARGELINEFDLAEALDRGRVAAAALDVLSEEPPSVENLLVNHPKVIVTPHIAASTLEAQQEVGIEIAEQVKAFLKHGVIQNAINFPWISLDQSQKLGPFISLGKKLGAVVSQISSGRINQISIRYYGDTVDNNTNIIGNAIIVRILKSILCDVNTINARKLLAQRDIELVETRSSRQRSYSNLISVRLKTDMGEEWVEGTILSKDKIRLVSLDGIDIEAPLTGSILCIRNNDTPGVIGQIGTLLGSQGVNIANFALGRAEIDQHAVGVVNVDSSISDELLSQISRLPSILFAKVVQL